MEKNVASLSKETLHTAFQPRLCPEMGLGPFPPRSLALFGRHTWDRSMLIGVLARDWRGRMDHRHIP